MKDRFRVEHVTIKRIGYFRYYFKMRRHNFGGICDSDVWIDVSAVEKCVSVCVRFGSVFVLHKYIDPLHLYRDCSRKKVCGRKCACWWWRIVGTFSDHIVQMLMHYRIIAVDWMASVPQLKSARVIDASLECAPDDRWPVSRRRSTRGWTVEWSITVQRHA